MFIKYFLGPGLRLGTLKKSEKRKLSNRLVNKAGSVCMNAWNSVT